MHRSGVSVEAVTQGRYPEGSGKRERSQKKRRKETEIQLIRGIGRFYLCKLTSL